MRGLNILRDWKFTLDEVKCPHLLETDDTNLKTVNIPHDWSVELPLDYEKGHSCTGYFQGGIGWYRKHFITTKEMINKKVIFNFDGIYCRSHIYINGNLVKFHPYGYSPVLVDVTNYLNELGEDNIIAVKVDHSRHIDSRWYTGSGIYRKVSMHLLPKIHIPVWGVYITTPIVNEDVASVKGNISIVNDNIENEEIIVVVNIYDEDNKKVNSKSLSVKLEGNSSKEVELDIDINNPKLWQIHNSYQYTYEVQLIKGNKVLHEERTRFGIRSFVFDANKGFIFNGKKTLIKGVCLHHDGGLVGAAVPKDVWRRRLKNLIDLGCNAIRTAHNPMDEDFLDLCDELGLLVQEEFYDEWDNPKDKRKNGKEEYVDYYSRSYTEFFRDYAKSDLQNVVLRDRNHPCIFQWSIGNEIEWTYTKYNNATGYFGMNASGNYFWELPPNDINTIREEIAKIPKDYYDIDSTAAKLSKWTKEMDKTRPVIANCILPSVSFETGYTDALDIVGFSYRRVIYKYAHENYPNKPIMGTENVPQWHEWKAILEHEYVPGTFLWTGIDHMGEAQVQGPKTRKGSNVGIIDLAGFNKPSAYMMKSLWIEEGAIKIFTQNFEKSGYVLENGTPVEKDSTAWQRRLWWWHDVNEHWNYKEGEPIVVEVYSNCEEISLYLNDELIETKYLKDFEDHIYKWYVPFKEGILKAVGKKDGEIVEDILQTTQSVSKLEITTDKEILDCDIDSVAHIILQFKDNNGTDVKVINEKVIFEVDGCGEILGVDNGDVDNTQFFKSNEIITSKGRALMIVRGREKGEISIKAHCPAFGLVSDTIKLMVK